ncbi:MAG: RloB family protein [Clostridiales bacterium]|nr:RloB family protein [Clostridiales bacterium]
MARAERNGQRKKRENFRKRVPDLGYYFIVTDTDATEGNYIRGLRDSLPNELQGRIVIKVTKAKTEKLVDACMEQASLEPQYGEPWIIFDRDEVVNFNKIIADAKTHGVNAGWSNPCIEIWFDAYFGRMHSYQNSVQCCRGFAAIYEKKTGNGYRKANKNIYAILNQYGNEASAITIAENRLQEHVRNGVNIPSEMCPCTTVHKLVEEIRKKTETGIDEKI